MYEPRIQPVPFKVRVIYGLYTGLIRVIYGLTVLKGVQECIAFMNLKVTGTPDGIYEVGLGKKGKK
jgi:hypothetical protein